MREAFRQAPMFCGPCRLSWPSRQSNEGPTLALAYADMQSDAGERRQRNGAGSEVAIRVFVTEMREYSK